MFAYNKPRTQTELFVLLFDEMKCIKKSAKNNRQILSEFNPTVCSGINGDESEFDENALLKLNNNRG